MYSASSPAVLVFDLPLCTYTLTPRGNRERPESGIYFNIFEKTQLLMNTLYMLKLVELFSAYKYEIACLKFPGQAFGHDIGS